MKQVLLLCSLLLCLQSFSQNANLTVVMIRHGEKNDATGNLSCQGLNRALGLPAVLNAKFPRPSAIYVPSLSDGKETGHARMFQTVTPFAVQDSLAINSSFKLSKDSAVAQEVMTKSGVILLVWEHTNIPSIAKALGIANPGPWVNKDFDSIWIVTYSRDKSGKWIAALKKDKEGLKPGPTCNF